MPRGLGFPSGATPGFSPAHIASGGIRFSGVSQPAGFRNLLNGKNGTNTGAPTAVINGAIGRTTNYPTASDYTIFTGGPSVTDTSITMAVLLTINTLSGFQYFFSDSGGDSLGVNSTLQYIRFGGTTNDSGLSLATNVPYFLAASANSGNAINFVAMRLDNGQFVAATTASGVNLASTGTYHLGVSPVLGSSATSSIAAAMKGSKFLSAAELMQWAYDPWSFWYPRA